MRIVVMSDSHGRPDRLEQVFLNQPGADWYLFLGDGLRDWEQVTADHPGCSCLAVRGNCDGSGDAPVLREECFAGRRVFFTHGHIYKVKYGLYPLTCAARERGAAVALFGHTHQPLDVYDDGLHLLNPGSLGYDGRYALLTIGPGGILTELLTL